MAKATLLSLPGFPYMIHMNEYYLRFWFCLLLIPYFGFLTAQDTLNIESTPVDTIYEITFSNGKSIKGKIIHEDVNRLRVVYLNDTITILRSNLQHIALYRNLGNVELTTIIFPKNHPEYGQELARGAALPSTAKSDIPQEGIGVWPHLYELELKTGSKLIGELVQDTSELVIIKVEGNELRILRKDVRSIRPVVSGKNSKLNYHRFQDKQTSNHFKLSYTPTAFAFEKGQGVYEGILGIVEETPLIWNTFEGGLSDHFSGQIGFAIPYIVTTRLKLAFGEHKVRGAVAWEGFLIPFDGLNVENIFRGIVTFGTPKAFASFSYGRFVGSFDEGEDLISIGGGFEIGEKLFVNLEWLILNDDYGDVYHLMLPRFDFVHKRSRYGITPSFVPTGDNSVIFFFTYACVFNK